jgi:LmbE family N-acetylglucosaminyl deacetylase
MKKYIINIISIWFLLKKHLEWIFQKNAYCRSIDPKNRNLKLIENVSYDEKVLILVPHADDELVGCYQFLEKYKKSCILFYFGFTGKDKDLSNQQVREKELMVFSKIHNIKLIIANENINGLLTEFILKNKPNRILIPTLIDWHDEHRLVNFFLLDIFKSISIDWNFIIYHYQISVPIADNYITHFLPMNRKEQNSKWEVFIKYYPSQRNLPVYRFKLQEQISGILTSNFAAEVYRAYSYKEWQQWGEYAKKNSRELDVLFSEINHIEKIRFKSIKIFENFYTAR